MNDLVCISDISILIFVCIRRPFLFSDFTCNFQEPPKFNFASGSCDGRAVTGRPPIIHVHNEMIVCLYLFGCASAAAPVEVKDSVSVGHGRAA